MKIKEFDGKKIKIRKVTKRDLGKAEKFQDFINSLVKEDVMISANEKKTKKEEEEWLKEKLENIRKKKEVFLVAEHDGMIVGNTEIKLGQQRQNHVGDFAISIRKEYRGIGLGKYLMGEILDLSKKELNLRIIKLSVFEGNEPGINLYKKYGFKEVARIPKQIQYKGELKDEVIMILEI